MGGYGAPSKGTDVGGLRGVNQVARRKHTALLGVPAVVDYRTFRSRQHRQSGTARQFVIWNPISSEHDGVARYAAAISQHHRLDSPSADDFGDVDASVDRHAMSTGRCKPQHRIGLVAKEWRHHRRHLATSVREREHGGEADMFSTNDYGTRANLLLM